MKIKESAFRDLRAPRRTDLSAARPVASHRTRHYCVRAHPKCTFINRRRVSLVSWEGDAHPPSRRGEGCILTMGRANGSILSLSVDESTKFWVLDILEQERKKEESYFPTTTYSLSANCHWERIFFQYRRSNDREREREFLASLDRILEFEIRFCYFTLRGASNLFSFARSIHFNERFRPCARITRYACHIYSHKEDN